jgi:hypothetical protein
MPPSLAQHQDECRKSRPRVSPPTDLCRAAPEPLSSLRWVANCSPNALSSPSRPDGQETKTRAGRSLSRPSWYGTSELRLDGANADDNGVKLTLHRGVAGNAHQHLLAGGQSQRSGRSRLALEEFG